MYHILSSFTLTTSPHIPDNILPSSTIAVTPIPNLILLTATTAFTAPLPSFPHQVTSCLASQSQPGYVLQTPSFPYQAASWFASQSQRGYALQEDHSFDTNNNIEKPKLHMLVNTNAPPSLRQSHSPRVRYKHHLAEQLKFSSSLAL